MSSGWLSAPLPEQGGRLSEIDTSVPHIARVYDYWLGGKDNFAPDRAAAEAAMREDPNVVEGVRGNRAFLARAVRYLAGQAGVRQFLDIGTGIPAADNTHEVAQDVAPECRVVYVDNDPIVLSHARALLTSGTKGATAYLDEDLRNVTELIQAAAGTLDFSEPVAVMLIGILQCIPNEDDPAGVIKQLMDAVPSGSYLAISHPSSDFLDQETQQGIGDSWNGKVQQQFTFRPHDQVARFFAGTDLIEPGLVLVEEWRPEPGSVAEGKSAMWGAIGRKR